MEIQDSKSIHEAVMAVRGKHSRDQYDDADAYSDLISAKTVMLSTIPFWGVLGINLRLVEEPTGTLPTIAVDGFNIYYNAEFIKSLSFGERIFALCHELLHCIYNHVGKLNRCGLRDPTIWNKAGDYLINYELKSANIGQFITTIKIYYDSKYAGMSTEAIYDALLESGDEEDEGGFDYHLDFGDADGEGAEGTIGDTPSDGDELAKIWTDAVVQAHSADREAKASGRASGSVPDSIKLLIAELETPTVNWKQVLRYHVRTFLSRGYSFSKPNNKMMGSGVILPSFRKRSDKLEMVVAVDTSGSIDRKMLTEFTSELKGVMESFPSFDITAFCFDSGIETIRDSVTHITSASRDYKGIEKFVGNIAGGGGTLFETIWDYMKEEKLKPRVLLVLTDGEPFGDDWGDPNYCSTMWLINSSNYGKKTAPFGITMQYDNK